MSSAKWVPVGALVLALAGQGKTKGMVAQMGIKATCNQSLAAVVVDKDHPRYLFWWLTSKYSDLRGLSGDDLRDGLNLDMVGSIPCPLPPMSEQRAIAAFLDRRTAQIDTLIAKYERLLELLEEKRQAVITRAVTKGLDPNVPMKDSGIEWLGEVPAHWDIKPIKRMVASADYGVSQSLSDQGEYPVVTMGDVQQGEVTDPKGSFVNEVDKNLVLRDRDLLYNRTNSWDQVCKVGIVRHSVQETTFASYLVRLRSSLDVDPEYLNCLLGSSLALAMARSRAIPSIQQVNLNPTRYLEIRMAIPPTLNEQQNIVSFLSRIVDGLRALSTLVNRQVSALREYRSALITAAVTGKIDVREEVPDDARQGA